MKTKIGLLACFWTVLACNQPPVSPPKNLIPEAQMVNILYDMSLLDAMRSQAPYTPGKPAVNIRAYIYQKYHVDSLQLVQSNRYYIGQIELYKKMYDQVNERLNQAKAKAEAASGSQAPAAPLMDLPKVE